MEVCFRSQWATHCADLRPSGFWLRLIATAALAPLRIAFAKGRPCEVVAMGVQVLADTLHWNTGWLVLQVDLKNFFNSIDRPAILDALEQR